MYIHIYILIYIYIYIDSIPIQMSHKWHAYMLICMTDIVILINHNISFACHIILIYEYISSVKSKVVLNFSIIMTRQSSRGDFYVSSALNYSADFDNSD